MRFLARLAKGDVALWRVFWLIGTPLALIWDASGGSMLLGIGVGEPLETALVIALFALTSLALVFVAFAVWRSASNYPRKAWWHTALAIAAKISAVFSALTATISFLTVLYLAASFVYAIIQD